MHFVKPTYAQLVKDSNKIFGQTLINELYMYFNVFLCRMSISKAVENATGVSNSFWRLLSLWYYADSITVKRPSSPSRHASPSLSVLLFGFFHCLSGPQNNIALIGYGEEAG